MRKCHSIGIENCFDGSINIIEIEFSSKSIYSRRKNPIEAPKGIKSEKNHLSNCLQFEWFMLL